MAYYDFGGYGGFPRYVPVGERRAKALLQAKKLEKRGRVLEPVTLAGKRIASSFWGKEWCQNLESYMDFTNRLPRGRTCAPARCSICASARGRSMRLSPAARFTRCRCGSTSSPASAGGR